jgi:two-component system sensor histidine kinase PhcS
MMKLFDGLDQVRRLSAVRQKAFWHYYRHQFRSRLCPIMIDINIVFVLMGAALDLALRGSQAGSLSAVHPLSYLYLVALLALLACNRITWVRLGYPVMAYAVFGVVATFNYLAFVGTDGSMEVFVSMAIFLLSIGFNTSSVMHTSVMLGLNLLLLYGAVVLITPAEHVGARYLALVLNWLLLFEMILALAIARVNRWLFAHFFALQFLLQERNEALGNAVRELHSTEDRLIQQQKHQALSHMASGLLHELLNPINTATQALNYARSIAREDELCEAIDDALSNQQRIAAIITDLRAFAQNSPPSACERVDLDALVEQAIKLCAAELDGIRVTTEGDSGLQVPGFPNALLQVLINLLLNAAEALTERRKAGAAEIRIMARDQHENVRLCIEDNGRGIAPEHLKRLTEPFYSADKDSGNMGLGLSICQTIVRHHEGELWIKSEPGRWTQVCLELPAQSRA